MPSEATESVVLEPHTDSTPCDICGSGTLDSPPAISSGPCTPADTELDRLSIFEFSTADVFHHSPLGDVLNSLKNLSLEKESQTNYVRFELEADDGEFRFPPATHFTATVEDLTDMPTSGSEYIDGIDDDADKEQGQDPPVIRRGTATPSYDVYMTDTLQKPRGNDKGDPMRMKLLRHRLSSGAPNAAPSHAAATMALEKIDAGMTPFIDNPTEPEPFNESSHEKVAKNNEKYVTKLCQGNDGRVRQFCRPKIAPVFEKELVHVDSHHTVHVPRRIYNKRFRSYANEVPRPEDVIPTVRTPPEKIRINSFLFKLHASQYI